MEEIYTANQIALYIIHRANMYGDLITNLKLQKLLYYAQAFYMVENNGKPLFSDDIEAWKYGPVVRTVYDEYKSFGHSPIVAEVKEKDLSFLNDKTVKFLDRFLSDFMDYSAYSLVDMIHKEDPWKDALDKNNEQSHEKISPESMYAFYSKELREREEKLPDSIINTRLEE